MSAILLAGATGTLGRKIHRELQALGVPVTALVRPGRSGAVGSGATVEVDLEDEGALLAAMKGVTTVVSALQGLEEVIVDGQTRLLRAVEQAKVRRFIPSDFAIDLFKVRPGSNRNFDFRRRFDERLDASSVQGTSILNGAFMDLLAADAGDRILDHKKNRIGYFGDADQVLDFTTMDDTAAFTARVAADQETPRILRISGERLSVRQLAEAATYALGRPVSLHRVGSVGLLRFFIQAAKLFAPGKKGDDMPTWVGMQYAENMFSGAGLFDRIDNDRYPDMTWTKVKTFLRDDCK